jgi:putative ABC transport system permease protein
MRLLIVAFKNLSRKKIRTFLTIGGVGLAVAVFVSLIGFDAGYQRSLNNDIDKMGYQVLVTAKGCPYEAATLMLKGGGGLRYMDDVIYEKIVSDERVDRITPQLVSSVYDPERLEGSGGFALYMGIVSSYLELKPWVKFKSGAWFTSLDADEVLMGYEAAEVEQRLVGDKVFIPGINKVMKVAGIFERTGTQDDGLIFMPLQTAQTIFDLPDKLTGIGIKLKSIDMLSQFEEDLYNEPGIQIISLAQVRGTIFNLISSARVMTSSVAFVAIFIAIIGVVNTILMSVFERTSEIGVMKAIGASRLDVFRIIWAETTFICLIGGVVGNIFAVLGGNIIEKILKSILPYAPGGDIIFYSPVVLIGALVGTIIMGLLAGIYPAFRASTMRPVEAIRQGD